MRIRHVVEKAKKRNIKTSTVPSWRPIDQPSPESDLSLRSDRSGLRTLSAVLKLPYADDHIDSLHRQRLQQAAARPLPEKQTMMHPGSHDDPPSADHDPKKKNDGSAPAPLPLPGLR